MVEEERYNPIASVMEFWDKVVADMSATAEEYRNEGWETLELHPGDVATMSKGGEDDKYGLDVLIPGDEMDEVQDMIQNRGIEFDSFEVYKAMGSELMYAVIVMKDSSKDIALLYPVYYQPDSKMLHDAREEGVLYSYIRNLTKEKVVELSHDDPSLFFRE